MKKSPWHRQARFMRTTFLLRLESLIETDLFIEKAIEKELRRKEKELQERLEKSEDEEEQDAIREYSSDDFYLLGEQLPKNYRYSMVVSTYSLLEQTMMKFCTVIKKHKPDANTRQFKGSIIEKAKQLLQIHGEVKFWKNSRNWNKITKYNKVRNVIVHNEGKVPRDKIQDFKKLLRSLGGGKIDDNRRIDLDRNFVPRMMRTIDGFLQKEMLKVGKKKGVLWLY